jgi:hypothetical protein
VVEEDAVAEEIKLGCEELWMEFVALGGLTTF